MFVKDDTDVNLNSLSEVHDRHSHGSVLINVTEEIPQPKLPLIKIVLKITSRHMKVRHTKEMVFR